MPGDGIWPNAAAARINRENGFSTLVAGASGIYNNSGRNSLHPTGARRGASLQSDPSPSLPPSFNTDRPGFSVGGGLHAMRDGVHYGFLTMLALVLLRLCIGWHFYSEGTHHVTDAGWSSEGFLKAAKGPLAEKYRAVLPDFHGWEKTLYAIGEKDPVAAAAQRISDGFETYFHHFEHRHRLSAEQLNEAKQTLQRRQVQLNDWVADNLKAIEDHIHEWHRLERARKDATADDLPFQKKRINDKLALLKKESNGWMSQLRGIETAYHVELAELLDASQIAKDQPDFDKTTLERVDDVMAYGITGIGVCLVLGLFTRLASLAGALFLLSVVLSQPFWLPDTQPTFNQAVEMFALLALATTPVGRWGGLDFFIHHLLRRERHQP
jgi:uncharacterized membrane protein YphA (DoxX/SURF4 family)